MMKIARVMTVALIVSTPAAAQVTTILSNNPASMGRDPNRVICEREQTTGTRLGDRAVCKTALEWEQLRLEHRETVGAFEQRNTSVGCQTGNPCGGGPIPR